MTDAGYSPRTVVWIITNLLDLRQGIWPDPIPSELVRYVQGQHAPFEIAAGMAGIMELKLKNCGPDGLMTKVYYVMGESDADLVMIARCPVEDVEGRIKKVIEYISGRPKRFQDGTLKTYQQFVGHRR